MKNGDELVFLGQRRLLVLFQHLERNTIITSKIICYNGVSNMGKEGHPIKCGDLHLHRKHDQRHCALFHFR